MLNMGGQEHSRALCNVNAQVGFRELIKSKGTELLDCSCMHAGKKTSRRGYTGRFQAATERVMPAGQTIAGVGVTVGPA